MKKLKKKKTLSRSLPYEEEEEEDEEAEEEGVETGSPPRLILPLFLYWDFRIWPNFHGIYFSDPEEGGKAFSIASGFVLIRPTNLDSTFT